MVRMVIRCCSISMRTLDHWLNASEILLASELSRATRNRYLRELNRRGFRAEGRLHVWVPFRDGVFVCQAASLEDELKPLLSVAALVRPLRVENYLLLLPDDVFEVLDTGNGKIAYKPTARYVNAAHLGKLYNIEPYKLSQFFSDHPHIDKQVKYGGPGHLQGSYISFEDARVFCAHFKVSYHPVEHLIALLSAHVAGAHNSAPSAPAALSAPDPPGVSETAKEAVYDAQMSYITEPSYANGSYLVPAAGSRLAPRNLQSCLAPSPAPGTPHDLAREFESERSGYGSWPAGLDSA
ncbi:hypothetical protein B0T22DRAFT_121531 [Podospora appendiculata]|uniref:HTH APSES-type domain-containing protein n=1 Tax=Podospora appendiculata TaxID=314037 RepID=A0AAE0X796_9PEZI|nr:hypothetical protein B0T22DRAFT_121531 [Podospora appendiculata]